MDEVVLRRLLEDQIQLMDAAAEVLRESHERVSALLRGKDSSTKRELTIGEKEFRGETVPRKPPALRQVRTSS